MAGLLSAFLRGAARQPFAVGTGDCALFVADWVQVATGRDGASELRGRYATPAEALALHGPRGLVGTVDRCARAVGLQRTRAPAVGDIAVIAALGELYCAIRTRRGWAVRADRAVMIVPSARVVAAWVVPEARREDVPEARNEGAPKGGGHG